MELEVFSDFLMSLKFRMITYINVRKLFRSTYMFLVIKVLYFLWNKIHQIFKALK